MDLSKVQYVNPQEPRTKCCRDCNAITPYIRKTYQVGRMIYAADECQACGDRSNIAKVDPRTLKEEGHGH